MKISAVIPTYNGLELLKKNLPILNFAFAVKANHLTELIIVDDGSIDETVSFLAQNFPQIKVIKNAQNKGFAYSVNAGVKAAKGDLVLLLNNDVLVTEQFLTGISNYFEDPMVFGVSLNEAGHSWAKARFEGGFINHALGAKTKNAHETFWVSGGSGVFRRTIWEKLGGMDSGLFNPFYWEDMDLCYRAAKRGWLLFWDPQAKVVHNHESTTKRFSQKYRQRISERNHLLFIWRNVTSRNLFRRHLAGLAKRVLKTPGYLRIVFLASLKLPGVIRARRIEKREAKVSDESIFAKFNA